MSSIHIIKTHAHTAAISPVLVQVLQQTLLGSACLQNSHLPHYHKHTPKKSSPDEMATRAKISYRKLRNEGPFDDDDDDIGYVKKRSGRVIGQVIRNWSKRHRKIEIKRKVKIGIPSLTKFLMRRRKVIVRSWSKVLKRLKDNQCQFGDLFAGNYMFMQVIPISFKYLDHKPRRRTLGHGFSSKYHLPRIP